MNKICEFCGVTYPRPAGVFGAAWARRRGCTRACYLSHAVSSRKGKKSMVKPWLGKKRESMMGEKNWAWKGSAAGYRAIHIWVEQRLGKASVCSLCQKNCGRIHWANIDHKYNRVLSDWTSLCAHCHYWFDRERNLRHV